MHSSSSTKNVPGLPQHNHLEQNTPSSRHHPHHHANDQWRQKVQGQVICRSEGTCSAAVVITSSDHCSCRWVESDSLRRKNKRVPAPPPPSFFVVFSFFIWTAALLRRVPLKGESNSRSSSTCMYTSECVFLHHGHAEEEEERNQKKRKK